MSGERQRYKPGELVVWYHLPRGGYGYVHVVPGVIVRDVGKRVRIAVRKSDGFVYERSVKPEALEAIKGDKNREIAEQIRESMKPRLKLVKAGGAA